ncbi:MAG: FAD-dependent oxidoreductase [Candidatus Omnitrophota bacterium]
MGVRLFLFLLVLILCVSVVSAGFAAVEYQKFPVNKEVDGRAEVIIIGAGISGLTAALELKHKGVDVLLLEKEPQVGGRMRSVIFDGIACNIGVAWVNADFSSPVDSYIKRFPLQPLGGNMIAWEGKVIEIKGSLLDSVPFSEEAKKDFSACLEKMRKDAAVLFPGVDFNKQKNWDYVYDLPTDTALWKKLEKQTIREYLAQYHPDVTTLWGTRVRGGFGGSPDNVSALFLIGWYRGSPFFPMTIIKGGNNLLPEEMSKEYMKAGGRLALNSEVTEISQDGKAVYIHCRDGKVYSSDYAVVTMPANTAKEIIKGLSPRKYRALAAVQYVPLVGIAIHLKNFPAGDKFSGIMFFKCGNSAAFMSQSGAVAGYPEAGAVISVAVTDEKKFNLPDDLLLAAIYEDIRMISPNFDPGKDILGCAVMRWPIGEVHMSPGFLSKYGEALKESAGRVYFGGEYASNFPTWGGGVWAGKKAAKEILGEMQRSRK